jgi:hypothetical protein
VVRAYEVHQGCQVDSLNFVMHRDHANTDYANTNRHHHHHIISSFWIASLGR